MLDIQFIRDNPNAVKAAVKNKNKDVDVDKLVQLDDKRREVLTEVEALRKERNDVAASMKGEKPSEAQIATGRAVKDRLQAAEAELEPIQQQYIDLMLELPNIPHPDVPIGKTEEENVVERHEGTKPEFDFKPKNHWEIAQAKDWIDKERAAKVTGARFAYLKGDMVMLQFAIVQYCMSLLTNPSIIKKLVEENNLNISTKPFVPVIPPMMIKEEVFGAMGRLEPKDDRFRAGEPEDNLWLQGSAEHTIGPMYYQEILEEEQLPIRYIGYATSFRREAGTYGKDTEGIIRMHQFDKCEMETFSTADTGLEEHLLMVAIQEYMMQELGLHYQYVNKCTADIGTPNARGIDIETWLPGQNQYRETHSADFMTDFQTRRMQSRVRRADGKVELMHTNDATALVLSRVPVAILENYQTKEGDVVIPEVLRPFMGGREKI